MTRAGAGALVLLALAAALALRLARLDARPMHHDEANQAVKFGALLERGEYRYDPRDHHGPTLYYLSLPAAWLRGQHSLAALDERTLRGVTVVFGAATILLVPLLTRAIGHTAVAAATLLMAVSPAMVFYSRMFVQESLFVFFTLAFVIAVGRTVVSAGTVARSGTVLAGGTVPQSGSVPGGTVPGGTVPALLAGVAAGLAIATKETAVIVLPAALVACGLAWWSLGPGRPSNPLGGGKGLRLVALGVTAAVAVAALFFTSFLAYPAGVLAPLGGVGIYLDRGMAPATHGHPWHYYIGLLAWSASGGLRWTEAAVLLLAVVGAAGAWIPSRSLDPVRTFWARYLAVFVALTAIVFSAIPYKTPWNLLPFYAAAIVLAGIGFSRLVQVAPSRIGPALVSTLLVAACAHLAWQAWRASVTYAADPRNPYVYAQTVPDAVRMAARIRAVAALHPDGDRMQVSVIASPYEQWPMPWYLRAMPYVGYWTAPGDPLAVQAPVIVSSTDHTAALDEALGERYVSQYFGLRPEVLLALYIERGLWERFLARVARGPVEPNCASRACVTHSQAPTPNFQK
jgi:uncharacterized protein (TIGR03663 family)